MKTTATGEFYEFWSLKWTFYSCREFSCMHIRDIKKNKKKKKEKGRVRRVDSL